MELARIVRQFATTIVNPFDLEDYLHRLTAQVTDVLAAQGCGIMVQDEQDGLGFAAASHDHVIAIERHQVSRQEGACFEAWDHNEVVLVADVQDHLDRWPSYTQRVLEAGYRAVLGVPMNAFGRTIGVLNVYRSEAGAWTPATIEVARAVAAMGAGALIHAKDLRTQHELTEHLHAVIEFRDRIGQAKGQIMARHDVDEDAAFEILRDVSQRANRRLRDIAELIASGDLDY